LNYCFEILQFIEANKTIDFFALWPLKIQGKKISICEQKVLNIFLYNNFLYWTAFDGQETPCLRKLEQKFICNHVTQKFAKPLKSVFELFLVKLTY